MEIYQLTPKGEMAAHNIYAPNEAKWKIIFYLSKRSQASKEQIINQVQGSDGHMIYTLRRKGFITTVGAGVPM